jgi:hypothetical protein
VLLVAPDPVVVTITPVLVLVVSVLRISKSVVYVLLEVMLCVASDQPEATEYEVSEIPPKHATGNMPRTLGTSDGVVALVPEVSLCANCSPELAAPVMRTIDALILPELGSSKTTVAGSPAPATRSNSDEPNALAVDESALHPMGGVAVTFH